MIDGRLCFRCQLDLPTADHLTHAGRLPLARHHPRGYSLAAYQRQVRPHQAVFQGVTRPACSVSINRRASFSRIFFWNCSGLLAVVARKRAFPPERAQFPETGLSVRSGASASASCRATSATLHAVLSWASTRAEHLQGRDWPAELTRSRRNPIPRLWSGWAFPARFRTLRELRLG